LTVLKKKKYYYKIIHNIMGTLTGTIRRKKNPNIITIDTAIIKASVIFKEIHNIMGTPPGEQILENQFYAKYSTENQCRADFSEIFRGVSLEIRRSQLYSRVIYI